MPYPIQLSAPDITRLFQSISQRDVYNFFSEYNEQLFKTKSMSLQRFWALDSTSVSTYARLRDTAFGHNKPGENIPQVNLMLITEQHSESPVYYEYFNGSVPDMSAATSSFNKLVHLNLRSFIAVMDRGYYSSANIAAIINQDYHLLLCAPIELVNTYGDIIAEAVQAFTTGQYFHPLCQQNIFTKEQVLATM